jgi:hypothetical protein
MSGNALAMGWDEWMRHDATSLAALVRGGQLTAQEVAAQAAAGVARVNGRLNGVLEVFDDVVADPQTDRPDRAGRLYGVPMFLKDLGSRLKGRRQEAGTRLLAGNVAKDTDPLVENFLSAGLVPMGRSTTPEFGMSFDTATSYLGHVHVTRNPWNTERTPGGSSGGSAAMVAAGVTPISVRIRLDTISATTHSPGFSGLTKRLPRLRLHISSRKPIETPICPRNRMSHSSTAAIRTPAPCATQEELVAMNWLMKPQSTTCMVGQ